MKMTAGKMTSVMLIMILIIIIIYSASNKSASKKNILSVRVKKLGEKLESLEKRQEGMTKRMKHLSRDINRSISLQETGQASYLPAEDQTIESSGDNSFDFLSAIEKIASSNYSYEAKEKIWMDIHQAGLTDEAIVFFERNAKENPGKPQPYIHLGNAYIQKLFTATGGQEKGIFAEKADKAYDAALMLDDNNWEARFSKAVALSFWPSIFGKQAEAIKHFKILIEQQEMNPPQPEFALSYIYLGNLYQQQGKNDMAEDVWIRGSEIFPDNETITDLVVGKVVYTQ